MHVLIASSIHRCVGRSSQGWLKSIHESAFRFQSITSIHAGDTQVQCIASVAAAKNIEGKKRVDGEKGDFQEASIHDGDTQVRCIASVAAAKNIEAKKRVDGEEGDDQDAAVAAQGTLEKQKDGEKVSEALL